MAVPQLILVNPWIYDFAAFDLWSKPLGLLYLASHLRQAGFEIHLIDCLNTRDAGTVDSPSGRRPIRRLYGTGKFPRHDTSRPLPLKHIPRAYSRYGISLQSYVQALKKIREPAALLATCMMTYWYPGVQEVIRIFREIHPGAPVLLGGTYARLCPEHAIRQAGADHVVLKKGMEAVRNVLEILRKYGYEAERRSDILDAALSYPAFDLLPGMEYAPILTSTGCPYRCAYCASPFLHPRMERRDPRDVLQEILFWNQRYGIHDFAFYDDALLTGAESHAVVFLEEIARKNLDIRFHTPNALHVREIRSEIAGLLFRAGFRTIRLGLETSDIGLHRRMGNKVSEGEFESAVKNLTSAGFRKRDIGAYILMGLPGQTVDSVRATVLFAEKAGAMPYLAEYSPMPHTSFWEEAIAASAYDLASEPLFHNNTLLPCWDRDRKAEIPKLRDLVRRIRRSDTSSEA